MKGQDETRPITGSVSADERAVIRHELGNVLNGLLGMTELLLGDCPRRDQERWLRAIEQSGLQLRRLIDRYSSTAPFGDGGLPVDGITLLEDTITSHAPAAYQKENRLLLLTAPGLPRHWYGDPCRLRQILDNLLGNAIRFSRSGEIIVEVGSDRSTLIMKVKDSGPGIRPGAEHLLFRPFSRNLHAEESESRGSGLGLYLCRLDAAAMQGGIRWVERSNGGSTFEFRLPEALRRAAWSKALNSPAWLRNVRCALELDGQLERSVRSFLARLGVACENGSVLRDGERKTMPLIAIKAIPGGVKSPESLELRIAGTGGRPPACKRLAAPILESGLAELLMEMVLEWRSECVSPDDSRD